jgi:hypothetical protein
MIGRHMRLEIESSLRLRRSRAISFECGSLRKSTVQLMESMSGSGVSLKWAHAWSYPCCSRPDGAARALTNIDRGKDYEHAALLRTLGKWIAGVRIYPRSCVRKPSRTIFPTQKLQHACVTIAIDSSHTSSF